MDKRQRMTLLGIAAAIAAAMVVIALVTGGGGGEKSGSRTAADTQAREATNAAPDTTAPDATAQIPERPEPVRIEVKGGEPVGGAAEIELDKDERAAIDVTAEEADEAHLHGYDVQKKLVPGKTAKFRFRAHLEGVYEMELHHHGTPIATVTVKP